MVQLNQGHAGSYLGDTDFNDTDIFSSHVNLNVKQAVSTPNARKNEGYLVNQAKRASNMDEYQEELLEYRASELDPVEPADDATEL